MGDNNDMSASTLEEQIAPKLAEAGVTKFDADTATRIDSMEMEVQWVILADGNSDTPYHTFTQGDLPTTTLQQFFDLVAGAKLDPVHLLIQVTEAEVIDD